jgi:hypothetical protein
VPDDVIINGEAYKVTTLGRHAFGTNITGRLTLGNGVTTIEKLAFQNCSNMTAIVLPDSLTTIVDHAFDGCTSLISANETDYKIFADANNVNYIRNGAKFWCIG